MSTEGEPTPGVTISEAAASLSISEDQVTGLIEAGVLTVVGDVQPRQITRDSLLIYMASRITTDLQALKRRPGRAASVATAFLPLLLGMWFLATCVFVFSLRAGAPLISPPVAVVVLVGLLGLAAYTARHADEFFSVNGLGTTLYGNRKTPEGRVGTQWLIIAGVPLIPLQSYVILESTDVKPHWVGSIRRTQFRLRALGRIHWPHAAPLLLAVWLGLGALLTLAILV